MAKQATKKVAMKRVRKGVQHGQAHIQSSFNNTIVTLYRRSRKTPRPRGCRAAILF